MRIYSNIPALFVLNASKNLQSRMEKNIRHLADGLRISTAADDAAGLAISEKLRAQVGGLDQAVRNAEDGVSLLQTAEGALNEVHSLVQRMRELSVQAANDTLTLQDRTFIQTEVDELKDEIDRIASTTQFNRKKLLSGDAAVLWSTDALDVKVFVDGSLRSKDRFGQTITTEGNYRILITPDAGEAEVRKSNIFTLKHGTVAQGVAYSPESGATSGLQGLRSLNLVEGEYRLETREVPFGGVTYYNAAGVETNDPATVLGVRSLDASSLPDLLPYGEYQVRVADEVPFMANFGGSSGGVDATEIVARADPMTRSDVDLSMSASNAAGAVQSQTQVAWTDIEGAGGGDIRINGAGGDVDIGVDANFGTNLWTHFNVTGTDARDTLASNITLQTSYRSEAGATAQVGLSYRSAATAVAAGNVGYELTYQTASNTQLRFTNDLTADTLVVSVNSLDIEQAVFAINAALGASALSGVTAAATGGAGARRIEILNNLGGGASLTIANETASAGDLGLAATVANGVTQNGIYRNYEATIITSGFYHDRTISQVANEMDTIMAPYNIDFAAVDLGGGVRQLTITNPPTAPGLSGANRLRILPDGAPGDEIVVQELGISGASVGPGATTGFGRVLDGYTSGAINIGGQRVDQIQAALQGAANSAFALDTLANPTGAVFNLVTPAAGERRIDIRTSSVTARYDLTLTGTAGATVSELFGGDQSRTRASGDVLGQQRDYDFAYSTIAGGQNIEEVRAAIDALGVLDAAWTNAANTPGYDGSHHFGRISIQNTDGTPERREVVFVASAGTTQLLAGGNQTVGVGLSRTSQTWQARDALTVATSWTGITAGGTLVAGARSDTWWEGDVGTSNPLAADANLPFSSVYIPDGTDAIDLTNGSWALFTSASSAASHDSLSFRIRDGATGSTYDEASLGSPDHGAATYGGARMVFDDGVLDGAGTMWALPHLFRSGVGTTSSAFSRVSFVTGGFDAIANTTFNDVLRTSERYDAAGAGWDVGGVEDDRWYAQEWYGEDTSYHLASASVGTALAPGSIRVWRQEDVNASLLFEATGNGLFHVRAAGYTRAGGRVEFEEDIDLNAHGAVTPTNPLILNAGGGDGAIRFDAFAPSGLGTGDRFVVNIAARAGGAYENATPGNAGAFLSDSIVTVDGDPWGLTGSSHRTMEYRFDAGVESLFNDADPSADPETRLRMLGFSVDPNNGDNATNVSTGSLLLNVDAGGFAAGTRAGENGGGSMPYVVAEVNYQGKTTPEAGAVVNSFFFKDIKEGEGERNFLRRIEYAADETRNAMLFFEVLGERSGGVSLRIQGHVMDRNGAYRYVEAETTALNNSNEDVRILGGDGFEGLHFTHFDFADVTRLREGDRFTLSLVADGRAELDPVSGRYAVDELDVFGGDTRPGLYPMSWRFNDGVLDNADTVLRTYQVAPENGALGSSSYAGKVYDGTLTLGFGAFNGGTSVGSSSDETPRVVRDAATFASVYREGIDAGVANRYSALRDIAQFWDANGRFLLEEPATILIRQGDGETRVSLNSGDEIQDLLKRLNRNIYEDLGDGKLRNLVASPWNGKFATFTGAVTDRNAMESVGGTLVLRSALAGGEGAYEFVGDEDVLKALNLAVINEAKENVYTVNISDAHSGRRVASDVRIEAEDDLSGVWGDAIRLRFDSLLGVNGAFYDENAGRFRVGMASEVSRTVHLADNATVLQIGANQGEDLLLSLGAADTETLGLDEVNVLSREAAGRSITLADRAIDRISRYRANLGALTNRLGHAAAALTVTSENLVSADSRLRDLDYAKGMAEFVRVNLLIQMNSSVLAQANQLPQSVLALIGK